MDQIIAGGGTYDVSANDISNKFTDSLKLQRDRIKNGTSCHVGKQEYVYKEEEEEEEEEKDLTAAVLAASGYGKTELPGHKNSNVGSQEDTHEEEEDVEEVDGYTIAVLAQNGYAKTTPAKPSNVRKKGYLYEEEEVEKDEEEDLSAAILAQSDSKADPTKPSSVRNKGYLHEEVDEEEEEEEEDLTAAILAQSGYAITGPPKHSPVTLSSFKKLVSAFKGSREKEGLPAKKVSVTWASDVYDPPPTTTETLVRTRTIKHRSETKQSKINMKNKQKWSGMPAAKGAGAKGKDKKQVKKYGGSSNKCFATLENDERLVDNDAPYADYYYRY